MAFSGNKALLVSAPMLQDYFVDNLNGEAMANGTITCYKDNSRTTLKNWYYQTGVPGNYTYIALPNPMTLSSVGTMVDGNGNDIIPFYYPYSEDDNTTYEAYYIKVENSNGQLQFTRQNFPFNPAGGTPTAQVIPTLKNYIVNNSFWRNIGSLALLNSAPTNLITNAVLAPSNHDGFSMPDLQYIKNVGGAVETISFRKFIQGTNPLTGDITPEFYINHNCTGLQAGETQKVYQFPISLHINQLENAQGTVSIQVKAEDVNPNNKIKLYLLQFTGTGTTSPIPLQIGGDIVATQNWTKFTRPLTFPTAAGAPVSTTGDDAYYLQISMPLGVTCNIDFTLPSLYLSTDTTIPTNNFTTYDEVDSIVNTPRTGDFRTSINNFQPFGWVSANDGLISNAGTFTLPTGVPSARQNIDTWPLFNLIWSATNIEICPIYTSLGVVSTKTTAIADWNANKQLQLTKSLGRALIGLPPLEAITYDRAFIPLYDTPPPNVAGVFTVTAPNTNLLLYVGAPVYLTGTMPAGGLFVSDTIYYAIPAADGTTSQFQLATSYANAVSGVAIASTGATDNGANLIINFALGGAFGQDKHIQLERELAIHNHSGLANVFNAGGTTGGPSTSYTRGDVNDPGTLQITTPNSGSSYPFNIVQPVTYQNVFIKL